MVAVAVVVVAKPDVSSITVCNILNHYHFLLTVMPSLTRQLTITITMMMMMMIILDDTINPRYHVPT